MKKKNTKNSVYKGNGRTDVSKKGDAKKKTSAPITSKRKKGTPNVAILAALSAVLLIVAIIVIAKGPYDERGLEYTINADGATCTITDVGSCIVRKVEIPEYIDGYKVTAIGKDLFYGYGNIGNKGAGVVYSKLKEITIPDSVTSIGQGAFAGCCKLQSVKLPANLETLGYGAFSDCTNLKDVILPESLRELGDAVFLRCSALEKMVIPDSVTEIGGGMFYECVSLKEVQISANVTKIGVQAFDGCSSLKEFEIPDGVTEIAYRTFALCSSLEKISVPDGITYIGEWAFASCVNLAELYIPDGVTEIGHHAFYECKKLKEITLPDSVKKLDFYDVDGKGSYAQTFQDCFALETLTLSASLEEIQSRAFDGCLALQTLEIPVSVKKLGRAILAGSGIKTLRYEGTVAQWNAMEKKADWFASTGLTEVICSDGTVKLETTSAE